MGRSVECVSIINKNAAGKQITVAMSLIFTGIALLAGLLMNGGMFYKSCVFMLLALALGVLSGVFSGRQKK